MSPFLSGEKQEAVSAILWPNLYILYIIKTKSTRFVKLRYTALSPTSDVTPFPVQLGGPSVQIDTFRVTTTTPRLGVYDVMTQLRQSRTQRRDESDF